MKIRLILALLSIQNVSIASADKFQFGCWDGTFGYNSFLVSEVEDGFEVSMRGAQLGQLQIYDHYGPVLDIEIRLGLNQKFIQNLASKNANLQMAHWNVS